MTIKSVYDKQDEIPEVHRPLFTERNGKWEVTGIEGMKPQTAYDAVSTALQNERNAHKETKTKLEPWSALGDPADIQGKLDKYPQLELAAAGKVKEVTDAQLAAVRAPLERTVQGHERTIAALTQENTALKQREKTRTIHDAVRGAFTESKGLASAADDALMYAERVFDVVEENGVQKVVTKDNVGVVPGLDAKLWLQDMLQKKPHWWPASNGGGASGSGGGARFDKNPWSKDHWNMTEQGRVVTGQGKEKAEQMARAAGSQLGAMAPPK